MMVDAPFKIAGFDMDWTLIKTKSGRTFAKDKDDWEFLYGDKTKEKMSGLHKEGFKVVIFTN